MPWRSVLALCFLMLMMAAGCRPSTAPTAAGEATAPPPTAAATTEAPVPATKPTAEPTAATITEPTAEPTAGEAVDWSWVFSEPYDPIPLDVILEEETAVEALIPLEGGSLTATSTGGTRFTLDIPGDALLEETTVRMTPVASVIGMPWGDGGGLAVRLEPEGLRFNNFVTLTIEPDAPIPVDEQIFFSFDGAENSLSLALPVVDSEAIQLRLLHFSGYGVSKGLLADTEPVRQRVGRHDEARLTSLAGVILQGARIRQRLGIPDPQPNPLEQLVNLFVEWEEKVVRPREAIAGESCAAGRLAIETRLAFERQKQLLGMADEQGLATIANLVNVAGKVCLQEEYELCRDEHIIHRMITVTLGMERQLQLLGASPNNDFSDLFKEGMRLTELCLRFELVFESTGVMDAGSDGGYTSIVKATVPLRFQPVATISGSSALVNESFEFVVPGCGVTNNRGGGTFEVTAFGWEATTSTPNDPLGRVTDLDLRYYPGQTSESFSVSCDGATYATPPGPYWTGIYLVAHRGELLMSAVNSNPIPDPSALLGGIGVPNFGGDMGGFVAEDWEIFGDEYYAKKEWQREDKALGIIEIGTFKLYHRPG